MTWATVSSWSCFCWLYRATPSLAAKNIINLISVLTIWWCPCVHEDLQDLLELTSQKDVLFIIGDWNAKIGSQETPGNRQIWPWSTEWTRAKANRVLPRERTGHSKHPLPTTQEKILHMDITRIAVFSAYIINAIWHIWLKSIFWLLIFYMSWLVFCFFLLSFAVSIFYTSFYLLLIY